MGEDALPGRPIAVPIFVFNNNDIRDDASYDGCPFIEDVESARINDDEVFAPFDWMMDGAREPIQEMYNLTDEYMDSLNFHHFETLTDEAVAVDFEGWPEHSTYFSDEEWELTHEFQKVILTYRDTTDASKLEVSRLLRKPLALMKEKVASFTADSPAPSDLKYMIYSAHDD